MGMFIPVGNAQGGMIGAVSRHAGAVALFDLGDEGMPQTMGTCGETELLLLEGERAIDGFAVHRLAVHGEEERAGMIVRVRAGLKIRVEHVADGQGAQLAHPHAGLRNERADGAIPQLVAAGHIAEQLARLLDGHVLFLALPFGDGLLIGKFSGYRGRG